MSVIWVSFQTGLETILTPPEVGHCLVLSGTLDEAHHRTVDCSIPGTFSLEVAMAFPGGGRCDEAYMEYSIYDVDRSGAEELQVVLCLLDRFALDRCYSEFPNDIMYYRDVDCADADFRITAVATSTAAPCPRGSEQYSYIDPPRTYCLEF